MHSGDWGIHMAYLHIFQGNLIPFLAVVVATATVALVCHYFTSGWPSVLESLFWDLVATTAACAAFIAIPLWHLSGAAPVPWSGEMETTATYHALLELSCLGSLAGYVLGAMLVPLACKRMGCWH